MSYRFVRDLDGFRGDAKLYEVATQFTYANDAPPTKWIVASAVIAYSGPETYLFPADESGKVLNWGELPGSQRGVVSHEEAMRAWAEQGGTA